MTNFSNNVREAAKACERFEKMSGARKTKNYKRENLLMDLTAADGVNGNDPIDWEKLMAFDDFNFLHDIGGIANHIDRSTGKLTGFFSPRATKQHA